MNMYDLFEPEKPSLAYLCKLHKWSTLKEERHLFAGIDGDYAETFAGKQIRREGQGIQN